MDLVHKRRDENGHLGTSQPPVSSYLLRVVERLEPGRHGTSAYKILDTLHFSGASLLLQIRDGELVIRVKFKRKHALFGIGRKATGSRALP